MMAKYLTWHLELKLVTVLTDYENNEMEKN